MNMLLNITLNFSSVSDLAPLFRSSYLKSENSESVSESGSFWTMIVL